MGCGESLLEDFELIKGDSSEIILLYSRDVDDFSVPNWQADMAISTGLGETPIIARTLPLNQQELDPVTGDVIEPANKYFVLYISPSESDILAEDTKYWLIVQVKNDLINYKKELVQARLKIKPQGIIS